MKGNQQPRAILRSRQMYMAMFVSQLLILMTLNTVMSGNSRMQDYIVAAVLACVANFLVILPLAFLLRRFPGKNILEIAHLLLGKGARLIDAAYILYFIIMASYYLSLFELFLANVMDPNQSLWVVSAAVMMVAAYSALRGIEGIVRAAEIIGVVMVIGYMILLFVLYPKFQTIEFLPFFENGWLPPVTGMLLILARTGSFALWGFFSPYTKGKKGKGYVFWNLSISLLTILILTAVVGALGANLDSWLFPIYSASAFAQTGLLQSMDALFIAMWICSLLAKLSMDLFSVKMGMDCMGHFFQGRRWPVWVLAAAIGGISLFICRYVELQKIFFGLELLLPATAVATIGIPLVLQIVACIRKKRGESI